MRNVIVGPGPKAKKCEVCKGKSIHGLTLPRKHVIFKKNSFVCSACAAQAYSAIQTWYTERAKQQRKERRKHETK